MTRSFRTVRIPRTRHIRAGAIGVLLALAMLLAACGGVGASHQLPGVASSTPIPGSAALNGCAMQHPPTNHLPAANVILTDSALLAATPAAASTLPPTVVTTGVANPVATTYANATPMSTPGVSEPGTPIVLTPGPRPTTQPSPTYNQKATAHVGQTLEVRLSASINWGLTVKGAQHAVTQQYAKNWYDGAIQACIWRFTAMRVGQAQLTFIGGLVCPRDAPCPAVGAVQIFAITVK